MSFTLASIVEGKAEVQALPALLRNLLAREPDVPYIEIRQPIRLPRDRIARDTEERAKALALARNACVVAGGGWILVLFDADDDCPATLSGTVTEQCSRSLDGDVPVSVVLANREYEAWFLAAGESLRGVRGFETERANVPEDPDLPRNAKGLVKDAMGGSYGEVKDQAALSASLDPATAARNSRSFRKLLAEWDRILNAARAMQR